MNYDPGAIFGVFKQWALRIPETPNDFVEAARLGPCRLEFHPYWVYVVKGTFRYSESYVPPPLLAPTLRALGVRRLSHLDEQVGVVQDHL